VQFKINPDDSSVVLLFTAGVQLALSGVIAKSRILAGGAPAAS
jgi:hypothetical protein